MAERKPIVLIVGNEAIRSASVEILHSVNLRPTTFPSAEEFLDVFDPDQPGCVILDVSLPGMNGLELQACLHGRGAAIPLIFVTAGGTIPMAVKAIKAGALDFLPLPLREQQALLDSVHGALDEDARRREQASQVRRINDYISSLTRREREVVEHLVNGKKSKEIAAALSVSPRTIEVYRRHVMQKMRVPSVAHLVRMVLQTQESESLR